VAHATMRPWHLSRAFLVTVGLLLLLQGRQLPHELHEIELNRKSANEVIISIEHSRFFFNTSAPELSRGQSRYPPLSSLVQGDNVTGNVEFLLDFVIAGFAKTGTTTLTKRFFDKHPEIAIPPTEVHLLTEHRPADMVRLLHSLKPGKNVKRGYKAPRDIADVRVLDLLGEYWPRTKLIVGLRHPVTWFNSFYNFKIRRNRQMPPAELLDGECLIELPSLEEIKRVIATKLLGFDDRGVCAELSRYHVRLSWMGKTNISDPEEEALLGPQRRHTLASRAPLRNPVFLYDMQQRDDDNITRQRIFLKDLQHYLGLEMPFVAPSRKQKFLYEKKFFDICDEKYQHLRTVLLRNGKDAATWIVKYFLPHPEVTVSSPDYFREILSQWHIDPCSLTN